VVGGQESLTTVVEVLVDVVIATSTELVGVLAFIFIARGGCSIVIHLY